ncbi:MAG: hypothetical protein ACRCSP_09905 [Rhodoglobus sp.]
MAQRELSLRVRYRLTPWWLKVLIVFVVSRVVTTAIMLSFAARQGPNPWTPANPDYFDFAAIWDGHWYYIIAASGYPSALPLTAEGQVGENAWAFMPAYPSLVRLLMVLSGQSFPVVSVLLSVACAGAAALMFYRLMHLVLPSDSALFAVVLFCFAPLSPILQVAYAESMHVLLLNVAFYLLLLRRYWMLIPVVAVMSLTRPSGLAFALTMVLHVAHRWWTQRPAAREREEFELRDRVAAITVMLFSGVMGLVWLVVAGVATGSITAYTDTELAWRAPYIGYGELVPFTPWVSAAGFWAPWFGVSSPLVLVLLALLVAGLFAALVTSWVKRLGHDLRFWIASYALYLLAVFFPQSSTFRLLVPLFPALGALAIPQSKVYRISCVLLCVIGQWVWVQVCWAVDARDWTPP